MIVLKDPFGVCNAKRVSQIANAIHCNATNNCFVHFHFALTRSDDVFF